MSSTDHAYAWYANANEYAWYFLHNVQYNNQIIRNHIINHYVYALRITFVISPIDNNHLSLYFILPNCIQLHVLFLIYNHSYIVYYKKHRCIFFKILGNSREQQPKNAHDMWTPGAHFCLIQTISKQKFTKPSSQYTILKQNLNVDTYIPVNCIVTLELKTINKKSEWHITETRTKIKIIQWKTLTWIIYIRLPLFFFNSQVSSCTWCKQWMQKLGYCPCNTSCVFQIRSSDTHNTKWTKRSK